MNRRGFLGSILSAAAAPAIVRADSLMRVIPVDTSVLSITAAGSAYISTPSCAVFAGGNRLIPLAQITEEMIRAMNADWAYDMRFRSGTKWGDEAKA